MGPERGAGVRCSVKSSFMLDIIIGVLLLIGAVRGFMKGIIAMLFSLGGLLVGMGVAYFFYDSVAVMLQTFIHHDLRLLNVLAFVLLWLGTMVGMYFVGQMLTSLIKILQLGFLNRLGGAALGFIKVFSILTVLLMLCAKLNIFSQSRAESRGSEFMEAFGNNFWAEFRKSGGEAEVSTIETANPLNLDSSESQNEGAEV